MKIAPIFWECESRPDIDLKICHTGQHFDKLMSDVFFEELGLPAPHFHLGISGGSHAEQTGKIMIEFEKILLVEQPDAVIVVGDVNSTLACSLTAVKLGIKVAHVESGLRSFDRTMPEEINRIVTDGISDLLFVSEESGMKNLASEGVSPDKCFLVGNIMIDSLVHLLPRIQSSTVVSKLALGSQKYILTTFHRPSNVDDAGYLSDLLLFFKELSAFGKIVFPIHPRTKANFEKSGLFAELSSTVCLLPPVGYIDFVALQRNAFLIVTDSGGIQEESTWLGVPCITVRNNTERPVTVTHGTNILAGTDLRNVINEASKIARGEGKKGVKPELWDGKTAGRIIDIMTDILR